MTESTVLLTIVLVFIVLMTIVLSFVNTLYGSLF